jgi:hypothetical protein
MARAACTLWVILISFGASYFFIIRWQNWRQETTPSLIIIIIQRRFLFMLLSSSSAKSMNKAAEYW